MFDDGMHNDGAANDDVYGADIIVNGSTEYYIYSENNTIGKFSPTNAEHDFYKFNVRSKSAGDLVINEFMASNNTAVADQNGEFDDWIEIYNKGITSVDISNYRLTDDASDFSLFSFPSGTVINPNQYLVVWADRDTSQSGYHADFKLSSGGETILLADSYLVIVDSITYGAQVSDTSFGRLPNGTGNFVKMPQTLGAQNSLNPTASSEIVINEFLASNAATQADQDGEFDDWIEIYNKGNSNVNISNYRLSDDATDLTLFQFPSGTILNANSYIIVWADEDTTQTGFHANFKISASGESLYLTDSALNFIDSVAFGSQTTDISHGRFPNGTGTFQNMSPTFSAQNLITSNAIGDLVINEFLASNSTIIADQDGEFDDWIELFNKGNATIDLSKYSLSDDRNQLNIFTFPAGTILMPDSFVVVWADGDTAQTGFHADFKISASGERLYLSDSALTIVDSVQFSNQTTDISFGRFPNGTGSFQSMPPTFRAINRSTTGLNDILINQSDFLLYPNPVKDILSIELLNYSTKSIDIQIFNNSGQLMIENRIQKLLTIETSEWATGLYFVKIGNTMSKVIVQ